MYVDVRYSSDRMIDLGVKWLDNSVEEKVMNIIPESIDN